MSIAYKTKRSKRAKRISITVKQTGDVIVTLPFFAPPFSAQLFVQQKAAWIHAMQEKLKKRFENKTILKQSKKDYLEKKNVALKMLTAKVEYFNEFYNFTYKGIRIRNQKSRWGSCSTKGNLNFNYALIYLPEKLSDYIIIHELCHLKEMNHGKGFWDLVAQMVPDHKILRRELKNKFINIT
ncbi:MAG: M48 family metallopeptidase [bacterium]|nr:M48 family metallopeptidase [bacterium]